MSNPRTARLSTILPIDLFGEGIDDRHNRVKGCVTSVRGTRASKTPVRSETVV